MPLRITAITRLTNGHVFLEAIGVPNMQHSIQANDLSPSNFSTIGTASADSIGGLQYDDASAVGQTRRFYRLTFP